MSTSPPPELKGIQFRKALYGGLVCSAFGILAWMIWLGVLAVSRNVWVIAVPFVGVAIALVIHFFKEYWESSRHAAHPLSPGGTATSPPRKKLPTRGEVATGTAIAVLAAEHFLEGVLHEVLVPLLASIVTLFPVGLIFSWAFWKRDETPAGRQRWFRRFVQGLAFGALAGLGAAVLTFSLHSLMGHPGVRFQSWALLGICLGITCLIFTSGFRSRGWSPLLGLALAAILIVLLSVPRLLGFYGRVDVWVNQSRDVDLVLKPGWQLLCQSVSSMLASPDLPGDMWEKFERETGEGSTEEGDETPSAWGWAYHRAGCAPADPPAAQAPVRPHQDRCTRLCEHLNKGWHSQLVRTFGVLFFFFLGLGLTPRIEKKLRPAIYATHPVRHLDRLLAVMMVLALAGAVWCIRRAGDDSRAIPGLQGLGAKVEVEDGAQGGTPKVVGVIFPDRLLADSDLERLKNLSNLRELVLRGTQIGDAGLARLQDDTKLEILILEGTRVTDGGLASLKGMSSLRVLSLSGTEITDAGLQRLQALGRLKTLIVSKTKVTEVGVHALESTVPGINVIR